MPYFRLNNFLRLQVLSICFGCLLTVFLPAQNIDSLVSAYHEASMSRNKAKVIEVSSAIGLLYMNAGEDDSAVFYYTVALRNAVTQMEKADAYTGIARSTLFTRADFSMSMAKKGLSFVKDTDCTAKVNLGNAIGIYYSRNGKYDSSLYYYTIALNTAEKIKDEKLIYKVKVNLGDLYSYQGINSTALKYQLECLNYFERVKDSTRIISTIINVGNTYNYMHSYPVALDYYMRVYPQLKNKKSRIAGNLFNSIAVAYDGLTYKMDDKNPLMGEYNEKQNSFLMQSLEVKTAMKDSLGIASTFINLGRLELRKKNKPEAIKYFNQSLEIANRINNPRMIRTACGELGDVYLEEKTYDKALLIFMKMKELGERDNDLASRYDALSGIYSAYEGMGDYKNAFEYLKQFKELQKELNNVQTAEKTAEAEAKYKNQEKQRENVKLMYENKLKTVENNKAKEETKWILVFSIGGFFLIVLIFYLFYRNAQIKAKAKEQQQVTKAVFESEQKERIRISRDLHDNVGTQLSLISNDIEWITHPLKTFTETEKSERLESIGTASKEVINTLRETIWALNKEEVSFEEFADKLKAHVQKQVKLSKNVQPSFSENLESTIMLGPSEALGLFRICQEAIANSLKYAHSEKLEISMSTENDKYKLSIADYGKGFDKSTISRDSNYGLANMKFRAEEISCTINIDSSPEKGTIVTIAKK